MSENYLPGDFVAVTGYLRAGKTMNAVRIAFDLWRRGYDVVSNIDLAFASARISSISELLSLRSVVFVWDEIQATLDSRQFGKEDSIRLTQESIYFGKRGNILIYTCPHFGMVDLRYRQLTQHVYYAEKVFVRGERATKISRFWYSGVGENLTPRGKFLMSHTRYRDLYATLDENVVLLPSSKSSTTTPPLLAPEPQASARSGSSSPVRHTLRGYNQ